VNGTDRVAPARLWAVALTILSFLPFANWIAGGHEAPWYGVSLSEWTSGSAISLGSALVLFLVLRRLSWWPSGWAKIADGAVLHETRTGAVLGVFSLALFGVVAVQVLAGRPLLIDEIVQVMQARILAEGHVSRPADQFPEFFSALHVVDVNGTVYSQFPPGGPLMLVPGVIAGAAWMTGPVFGAIAVVAFWFLVRRTETPSVALGAAALLAIAPFMVFMAGSHMNHVPTLAWLCLALLGLHYTTSDEGSVWSALFTGLCLGVMVSIRPVDGAAFALPAGVWLLVRTAQRRTSLACLLASGVGVAAPVMGVLAYNFATTGSPTLFGYELLWGASHGLGFHRAPWGVTHTPARGFELVNTYFMRLQTYLFETPLPSLVPAIAALAFVRRLTAFDRYLLASSTLLVLGYFAYWHDGFFLGPRFFYLLLPLLVLWTARLPSIARDRLPQLGADRFVLLAYAVSAVVAILVTVPVRATQYANGMLLLRHDYVAPAARAGVQNALILVRESWGAQLIARLYALGVSRSDAEALYRSVDTCILDEAIAGLEIDGRRGPSAMERLRPLTADSLRLVISTLSPDGTERVLPGTSYSVVCQRRVLEDRAGYAFFAPLLARDPGSNLYARDLHARDTLLLQRYAGRPVYVLRLASSEMGAPLKLEPLSLDSARAEWASLAAPGR
jgi:4-amino-4-deoxy-L-arabinose transferase-like glycosyltransferase